MEKEETRPSGQQSVEGSRPEASSNANSPGANANAPRAKGARLTPEEIRAAEAWARARGFATLHTATRKSANAPANPPSGQDASA